MAETSPYLDLPLRSLEEVLRIRAEQLALARTRAAKKPPPDEAA